MNNELRIVLRGVRKNKIISLITVFGLSIALASCLLILFYISFEFSHDDFHEKKDHIYRIDYSLENAEDEVNSSSLLNWRLAEVLKKEVPGIKHASPFRKGWAAIIKYRESIFNCLDKLGIVEADFLNIFTFPTIAGSAENAFESPQDVFITRSFADKIIDKRTQSYSDLIGQPIEFLNVGGVLFTIKGVLEDIPKTSSIDFELLISFENQRRFAQSNNSFGNASMYIELHPEADPQDTEATTGEVLRTAYDPVISQLQSRGSMSESPDAFKVNLLNISDLYLDGESHNYESSGKRINSVILFIIGALILFTACINYLLLSLGLTIKRTHQIGVLKVFGASRWNILKQFWLEALLLTTNSVVIGLILSHFLFPIFKQLAQRDFEIALINKWAIVVFLILAVFLVTLLIAGPLVLFFRKANPSILLKKQIAVARKPWLSNLIVLFQYFISTVLIVCTVVILKQTNFLKNEDLGFNTENIFQLFMPADFSDEKVKLFKNQLLRHSEITGVAGMDKGFMGNSSTRDLKNENQEIHTTRIIRIDNDYLKTMEVELIRGEDFTIENVSPNNREAIVNQKFFETMNIPEAIDSYVEFVSPSILFRIRGIVRDFHFDSMKDDIEPLMLISNEQYERLRYLFVKYPEGTSTSVLNIIEKSWNDFAPGRTFEYEHLDGLLATRYEEEESWGKIVGYSALLAILISSLGLFGLSLIIVNKRIREIGIRKVHGASVRNVLLMLNKSLIARIMLAFLLACPVAYYIMSKWLENFVYRTNIQFWIFLMAGAIVFLISVLTINWQCLKSARTNPIDSIRYE